MNRGLLKKIRFFPCLPFFYTFAKLLSKVDLRSTYNVPFKGLKEGKHLFDFDIDNTFFALFEESEVKQGQLKVQLELTKQSTLLILSFSTKGKVRLTCDRCLEEYDQEISNESKLYVKFGQEAEDLDDNIIVLPFEEHQINVAQYIYELVILGLPIKRVHPNDKKGNSTCDPEMLAKLDEYLIKEADEEPVDERWSELKKLLDNK